MLLRVVALLFPVVAIVGLGAALLHLRFYGPQFRRQLDRLVYWIALPAFMTSELSSLTSSGAAVRPMLTALLGATLATLAIAYGVASLLRLPGPLLGVCVQGGFRGNLAFVGLPVLWLVEQAGEASTAMPGRALLLLAPMVLFYNVAAVLVLELSQSREQGITWAPIGRSLLQNPLIWSTCLGLALAFADIEVPRPLSRTLELVGSIAGPLALLSLGGTLAFRRAHARRDVVTLAVLLKVVALPLLTWLLGSMLRLDREAILIVMVLASTPTAVASYVLAGQLGGDETVAGSIVVWTTLLSAGSLAAALTWA